MPEDKQIISPRIRSQQEPNAYRSANAAWQLEEAATQHRETKQYVAHLSPHVERTYTMLSLPRSEVLLLFPACLHSHDSTIPGAEPHSVRLPKVLNRIPTASRVGQRASAGLTRVNDI